MNGNKKELKKKAYVVLSVNQLRDMLSFARKREKQVIASGSSIKPGQYSVVINNITITDFEGDAGLQICSSDLGPANTSHTL